MAEQESQSNYKEVEGDAFASMPLLSSDAVFETLSGENHISNRLPPVLKIEKFDFERWSLGRYYEYATEVALNPDTHMGDLAVHSYIALRRSVIENAALVSELDRMTAGNAAGKLSDGFKTFVTHLTNNDPRDTPERKHFEPHETAKSLQAVKIFRKALENYEQLYSKSTIFMPRRGASDPIANIRSSKSLSLDENVQRQLALISQLRRETWRIMDHFTLLATDRDKHPNGVINLTSSVDKLILAGQERMKLKLSGYTRYLSLKNELDDSLPQLPLDTRRFTHTLAELFQNAVLSTILFSNHRRGQYFSVRNGSNITTRSFYDKNSAQLIIEIQDNGIGIEDSELGHIRKYAYSQSRMLDDGFVKFGGRGVGLALSCLTVQEHNGSLEIDSDVSQGTTVKITLPLHTFIPHT